MLANHNPGHHNGGGASHMPDIYTDPDEEAKLEEEVEFSLFKEKISLENLKLKIWKIFNQKNWSKVALKFLK